MAWVIMSALNFLWEDPPRPRAAADRLALLMVAVEQMVLDGGSWDVAWIYTLMDEPPWQMLGRVPDQQTSIRTFPRLADQRWSTAALAYMREMDLIATRRRELAGNAAHRAPAVAVPKAGAEGQPVEQRRRPRPRAKPGPKAQPTPP